MPNKLEIKYLPIDSIVKYVNNTRTHSREQIDQIKASIKEFGMCTPVGIHNDVIVYGHARHQAMQELGEELIPTVDLSHLTEAQKKAYVIADNQLALNADWNFDLLKLEVATLDDLDFDVDLLGFDNDFLESLLEEPELLNEGLIEDDHVPEPPEEPVTKLGDVWLLGDHRLMCGDSTSVDAVEKLTAKNNIEVVFTDIPYNISQNSNGLRNLDYGDWDKGVADIGIDISSHGLGNSCYYFCSELQLSGILQNIKDQGFSIRSFVWKKPNPTVMNGQHIWLPSQELCAYGKNKGAKFNEKCAHAFWDGAPDGDRLHPNQKPVKLINYCLDASSDIGDNILDYFGGSGSTLIACEKTNRKCFMMELSEKYCDVIINRWQEFTGGNAILESSGESFNDLRGG